MQQCVDISCPLGHVAIASPCNLHVSPFDGGHDQRGKVSLHTGNRRTCTVLSNIIIGIKCSEHSNGFIALHRNNCAIDCYRLSRILIHQKTSIVPNRIVTVANGAKHDANPRLRLAYGFRGHCVGPNVLLRFIQRAGRRTITHLNVF